MRAIRCRPGEAGPRGKPGVTGGACQLAPQLRTLPTQSNLDAMPSFLKQLLRFFAVVACVPVVVGFVSAWQEGLGFLLLVFGVPIATIVLLIGTVVWFIRGLRHAKEATNNRDKLVFLCASPLSCVCVALLALPLIGMSNYLGTMSRLFANYKHYQEIIAKVEKNPQPYWYEDDEGVTFSVDLGPPIRVAFNPAGMLDNWSGIIYDPTGDVMQARGFDPVTGEFAAPEKITKLFSGDLYSCRHLWGRYYDCSFT